MFALPKSGLSFKCIEEEETERYRRLVTAMEWGLRDATEAQDRMKAVQAPDPGIELSKA